MKFTIDTDSKTIEILSEVSIEKLNNFINDLNLQSYKVVPSMQQPIYTHSPIGNSEFLAILCDSNNHPF